MEAENSSNLGVNLIAYIRAEMGLGSAARGMAMALDSAHIPFNVINFEHSNPARHRDVSWRHKEADHSSYDFSLLVVNPDNLSNATARAKRELVRDRYTIGYWFWELPQIPDTWLPSFSLVDEVWTGSRFVQDAISIKSPVPVFRVPIPVRLGPTDKFSRQSFGLPEGQFLFLSLSDTHSGLARKNPLGAIQAFKKAFPGDNERVGLVLRINNASSVLADLQTMTLIREAVAGHRNIYLLEQDMARQEIDALLALSDSFISVHRSEGFGLGPAEAMSLGKPVILTNWSGNVDYMTPHNSIGINYQLVPLGKKYGPYSADQFWAEPDLEQAAFGMKQLVENPDLAKRMGHLGQETIRTEFSPEVVGGLIRERLSSLKETGLSPRRRKVTPSDREAAAVSVLVTSEPAPIRGFLTIYSAGHAGYSEDLALEIPYRTQRWSHLHVALEHGLGINPLRLDPMKTPGLIDVAGIAIKSALDGKVLWKATRRGGLEFLKAGGSAVAVPHSRVARFLSYGEDPQILLPPLAGPEFEGPLRLEIWLKAESRFDRADDPMLELARLSARLTAEIGEARLFLERTTQDCSAKETQLEQARQEVAERNSQIGLYQAELGSLKKEVARVAKNLDQAQSEIGLMKKETARIQGELAMKCDELDAGGRELAATAHELTTVGSELAVLKRQLLNQQKIIDEIRAKPFWEDLNPLRRLRGYSYAKQALRELGGLFTSSTELDSNTFWLEHPTGPSVAGEKIPISGWVVSTSGERIEGVEAVVDGNKFTGLYGLERPDVAAAHAARNDFLHSGFVIDVTLPPGSHQISLRYLTRSDSGTIFCTFQHDVREALD